MNWRREIGIPLWAWEIFWVLTLIGAQNIISASIAGILIVWPFIGKQNNEDERS